MSDEDEKSTATRVTFTEDRFDSVPQSRGRIGAHRVVAKQSHFWQWLLIMVVAIVVLTAIGIFTLSRVGADRVPFAQQGEATSGQETKVTVEVDPDATVAVLNGTETAGLGDSVGDQISTNKWGNTIFVGNSAEPGVEISAVFYTQESDQSAAAGLAEQLGGVSTYLNESYADLGTDLVVVLGTDYAGPGMDEAAEFVAPMDEGFSETA